MKKHIIILIALLLPCILFAVWLGSVIYCSVLTNRYGDEFQDFQKIDFDNMVTSGWEANIRVMQYSDSSAIVYYFDDQLGVQVSFQKSEGQWRSHEILATWSATGSASDYFIGPYFKNLVP